ncbi:PfkB family carbohydrate kinase, partial [bacterium]|nr:PfkB family carbohydrate kinase [bacterium]
EDVDNIILQDYNKGLFVAHLITEVIKLALEKNKQIYVDPKYDHFFNYRGVTVFKPNLKEVIDKLGVRLNSDQALEKAGEKLLNKIQSEAVLITLGESGIALFEKGKSWRKVPTRAVKVHDVSGAGDTVIATLAVAMASGANFREAATIANHAAGIVCEEVGIVPVDCERLFQSMYNEIERV